MDVSGTDNSDDASEKGSPQSMEEDSSGENTDFSQLFDAYGNEKLPHQETTKTAALLLIVTYVISAELT